MTALSNFIKISDALIEFNAEITSECISNSSVHSLEVHKEEFKGIWQRIRPTYEASLDELLKQPDENTKTDMETLKARYHTTYTTYVESIAKLSEAIESKRVQPVVPTTAVALNTQYIPNINLPPCDTELFHGDYLSWPTFRDLFTAIYVKNSRLSPVERLFHLNNKTRGEAREIVRKAPLTNEGFDIAWKSLQIRFDNKRLLINSQLKVLFNIENIPTESGESIKKIQSTINSVISALKLYSIDIQTWDPIFVYLCCTRLPEVTLGLWEQSLDNKTVSPPWSKLDSFLTSRFQTLETVSDLSNRSASTTLVENPKPISKSNIPKRVNSYQNLITPPPCKLCPNQSHTIRLCPRFIEMAQADRLALIRKLKLCLNCFSKAHVVKDCPSAFDCFRCHLRHNTLLHITNNETTESHSSQENPVSASVAPHLSSADTVQSCFATNSKSVLLGTAVVNIIHSGTTFPARALLDSGSEASFISEHLFNLLKLNANPISTQISGLNGMVSAKSHKICCMRLSSPLNPNLSLDVSAIVIPQLTSSLPTFAINRESFPNLPNIRLADPEFYRTSYIDILIGADIFPRVMLCGVMNQVCGSLMAQETVFGWILTGPIKEDSISSFQTKVSYLNEVALDKQLSKFWEVEDIPRKKFTSEADKFCENHYKETTKRDSNGRYVVSLPFKSEFPKTIHLGQSKSIAIAQFFRNETRFLKNPELKCQYDAVLTEYLKLGHMKEIVTTVPACDTSSYYLPHHAVLRPESTTTKLRVVFNASCPSSNGVSLNDVLHPGPALQLDLTILLLQWRFYKIVFNSDIEKMYRQIGVDSKHTPFQRVILRDARQNVVKEYELQTVTFGLNCAPFLALRTIQQLATDVTDTHPLASNILSSGMYVDDVLSGSYDVPSAIRTKTELISALGTAGFSLRKWTSNSPEFLKTIPNEHLLNEDFLNFEDSSTAKTLGVKWNAKSDHFYFTARTIIPESILTKRRILSEISKLFDPAGWLCPFIVLAKLLMRDIWSSNIGWDDSISNEIVDSWHIFIQNYSDIEQIQIPRWIDYVPGCQVQLHGFCDASEKAYAATIYIRIETPKGAVRTHLLTAKTRVAPLKTISIPRLELCGALLLAETIDSFRPAIPIPSYDIFCWTDSMIVLAWLKKPPFQWKTFVANRVSKISEVVSFEKWSHVDSKHNPADIASRGAFPTELINHDLWWFGPSWLKLPAGLWPITISVRIDEDLLESRSIQNHFCYFENYDNPLDRFSSLGRALRVLSYVFRFISRSRKSNEQFLSINLENSEIINVRNRLIILSQKHIYSNEYRNLSKKELIQSSSSLSNVHPFLDSNGLMRVCSRVANSESLTFNEKFPIILPHNSTFSKLLLKFIHLITLHGGNSLMLRMLRLQFWIPRAKNLIKSIIHRCKVCVISKHKMQTQLMGTLPAERTTLSRPFTNTGIDFAGPFEIKTYTGRSCIITKGYVCIFVCFATRAIHLELTSSLSAPAFLAAFHRFVSRRGCPRKIYSDNGKTFVGASKDLAINFVQGSREFVLSNFEQQNVSWHFIPPGAPHMGGLWEAGVKSFKAHFRKMAGTHRFTFEEFSTILSRIEACLNSRPISPLSDNPDELVALTPGHFLVGGPLLSIVESHDSETNLSILNRWRRVKALSQQFSIRWKHEYLKELHKRVKWQRPQQNIQIGSLVVIREENMPPTEWRLGRVSKVYVGKDNLVRVVDIITEKGVITRPLVKLVLLPTSS